MIQSATRITAVFTMNAAIASRAVGRRRRASSTIASNAPVAPDAIDGHAGMLGTARPSSRSNGRPIAFSPQATSAPRQA